MNKVTKTIVKELVILENNAQKGLLSKKEFFQKLSELDNLYKGDKDYELLILSAIVNVGADLKSITILQCAIKRINLALASNHFKGEEQHLYFYLGNAIHAKGNTKYSPVEIRINELISASEFSEARTYYNKLTPEAGTSYFSAKSNNAGILNQHGRNFEAIYLFEKIISENNQFGMAYAKQAQALEYYFRLTPTKNNEILALVKYLLEKGLVTDNIKQIGGLGALAYYENLYKEVSTYLDRSNYKVSDIDTTIKSTDDYLMFIKNNNLFLNYHFGFYINEKSYTDHLFPPFLQRIDASNNESVNKFGGFDKKVFTCVKYYNQILEDFTSARYLYYISQVSDFSKIDKKTNYIYTFDFSENSTSYGFLKTSFIRLFNILDKIAHLLYTYFVTVKRNHTCTSAKL